MGKDLSFEPSRKLSVITGILAGLTERKKTMEAQEAEAAKNQLSLMRQLMPTLFREQGEQRRFETKETRESKEFGLEFEEKQRENARSLVELQAKITNWQENIRIADAQLGLETDRVGLEERRVVNTEARTIMDQMQTIIDNLQKQLEEQGRTSRAKESIKSTEGIAARTLGGITQRFESEQKTTNIKDTRDRFDAKAEKLQAYQEELANPESVFRDDPGLSALAVAHAKDLTADWVQLVEFAKSNGAPIPQRPPQLKAYEDNPWYRSATFGIKEVLQDTNESQPKRKDLLPTLIKPTPTQTTSKVIPTKAIEKVQAAIDAAKIGKLTILSAQHSNRLLDLGYTPEEITQIADAIARKKNGNN